MWKLSGIEIRNIVSFREASLQIEQGVATMIFGRNEDNASQPCNGSGKSSLIEAIAFALTGEQLRKVKSVEEIINDCANEAYVFLSLTNDYDNTELTIERTLSRTAPQVIECHKYDASGKEIEKDKTIQPTVADYNKFILNEIGLSKDDIYNNYILCDNKYESFFDCSDKNKKEIINRFSNGVIIDDSIAKLQADMVPVAEALDSAKLSVSKINGSISAIGQELENAAAKQADSELERKDKISKLKESIKAAREVIESKQEATQASEDRLKALNQLQSQLTGMEESEKSVSEAYNDIQAMIKEYELPEITNYDEESSELRNNLSSIKKRLADLESQNKEAIKSRDAIDASYEAICEEYSRAKEEHDKSCQTDSELKTKLQQELDSLEDNLDKIESKLNSNKSKQSEISTQIARYTAMLNGATECPKCGHKFFIEDDCTVSEVEHLLDEKRSQLEQIEIDSHKLLKTFATVDQSCEDKSKEIHAISDRIKSRNDLLIQFYDKTREIAQQTAEASEHARNISRQVDALNRRMEQVNDEIDTLRQRMFRVINHVLSNSIMQVEQGIAKFQSEIEFQKGQISQYRKSIETLESSSIKDFTSSLKVSLKKYESDLEVASKAVAAYQKEYDLLKEQEVNFTLFKSYIARKKIDALSHVVNDFLEKIGSDIRLKLEGFSVTKAGKLRDKISVQVMRDGIDCGSYHKFSGGEKARLNLACILSLHTLTNSNCEDGKGLDFIIIDELLDKSDEVGLATYCEALNKLKQTSLLITQGSVSEGYPYKLLITKRQGFSTIN